MYYTSATEDHVIPKFLYLNIYLHQNPELGAVQLKTQSIPSMREDDLKFL